MRGILSKARALVGEMNPGTEEYSMTLFSMMYSDLFTLAKSETERFKTQHRCEIYESLFVYLV